MTQYIDGKALAAKVKARVREEAAKLPRKPGLAVILVGENPASKVYVAGKEKDCTECDIVSFPYKLSEETTQEDLLQLISELNNREEVDGILVQLPLPKHLDEREVINAIAPDKDVDCFHPVNVGKMSIGEPAFLPCTPAGCMEMLKEYEIDVRGKRCVVLGRSNIVGKPMAMLLTAADGTVTTCHSRTVDLPAICAEADILVSAIGKTKFVTADMVKDGAVVIDVAMNRDENGKLCGDVDFENVKEKCSFITPVPGGVGPMTISTLMKNTLKACKLQNNIE